jgi:hypothetical protein
MNAMSLKGLVIVAISMTCVWHNPRGSYAQDDQRPFAGDMMNLMMQVSTILHGKTIPKELELTDEQIAALKEMEAEYSEAMKGPHVRHQLELAKLQDDPSLTPEDKERLSEELLRSRDAAFRVALEQATGRVSEILLPFQLQRLKQLALQVQISRLGGRPGFERFANLTDKLGLTEEQAKEFEKALVEIQKEYAEELAKLRKRYTDKMIAALPPDAQKKLTELIGDLDFSTEER